MIYGKKPVTDVPCGICGEKIQEWVQAGPDDDDLSTEPCGHTLKQHFYAWIDRLRQKR